MAHYIFQRNNGWGDYDFIVNFETMELTDYPEYAAQIDDNYLGYLDIPYLNSLGFYPVGITTYSLRINPLQMFIPGMRGYRPVRMPGAARQRGAAPRPMPGRPAPMRSVPHPHPAPAGRPGPAPAARPNPAPAARPNPAPAARPNPAPAAGPMGGRTQPGNGGQRGPAGNPGPGGKGPGRR